MCLSNYNLPAGAQHRQAAKQAAPANKYESSGTRREPAKTVGQLHTSCFQTDFTRIGQREEQRHQQLLRYKLVFEQLEAGQSFSTP